MSEISGDKALPTSEWLKKFKKKLYHWTYKDCLQGILKEGLKPSGMGFSYLSPKKDKPTFGSFYRNNQPYEVLLEIRPPAGLRLSSFLSCREWEILCWGLIPPENITILTRFPGKRFNSVSFESTESVGKAG